MRDDVQMATSELVAYDSRRREVREKMVARQRGASSSCAYDLRVAPTVVSRVLNGKQIHPEILGRIEEWLAT